MEILYSPLAIASIRALSPVDQARLHTALESIHTAGMGTKITKPIANMAGMWSIRASDDVRALAAILPGARMAVVDVFAGDDYVPVVEHIVRLLREADRGVIQELADLADELPSQPAHFDTAARQLNEAVPVRNLRARLAPATPGDYWAAIGAAGSWLGALITLLALTMCDQEERDVGITNIFVDHSTTQIIIQSSATSNTASDSEDETPSKAPPKGDSQPLGGDGNRHAETHE